MTASSVTRCQRAFATRIVQRSLNMHARGPTLRVHALRGAPYVKTLGLEILARSHPNGTARVRLQMTSAPSAAVNGARLVSRIAENHPLCGVHSVRCVKSRGNWLCRVF